MANSASSAFRLYAEDHPVLARRLRDKLEHAKAILLLDIASGYAADWADYKHRVGQVAGLDAAIKLAIETDKELNGEPN